MAEIKGIGELLFPWIDWESDSKANEYKQMWEDWYGVKVGGPEWEAMERQGEMLHEMYKQGKGKSKRGKTVIDEQG